MLSLNLTTDDYAGIARPSNNAFVRQIFENYVPTAIATFIEPVWVLVNRLLCTLQPLEELRRGKSPAEKSIDADYSSIPPQLVIVKAIRSCHFKLAVACLMALLANILAIALAGLLNEGSILIPQPLNFQPPFHAKFVRINGSVGPNLDPVSQMSVEPSGAFTGGLGVDHFLVAESNYSANTPLPPWTDENYLYVPFMNQTGNGNRSQEYRAQTYAFGSTLKCSAVLNYTAQIRHDDSGANPGSFEFLITDTVGREHSCNRYDMLINSGPVTSKDTGVISCTSGGLAMELVFSRWNMDNATAGEKAFCAQTVVLGWARDTGTTCPRKANTTLTTQNALFVACQGQIVAGEAQVVVDGNGHVQEVSNLSVASDSAIRKSNEHFTNDVSNLVQQGHNYLFHFPGTTYHNDSFASDFMNYFMIKQSNSSQLVDPKQTVPSLDDITKSLYPVYSKLFAIWLGVNREKLLEPATTISAQFIEGQTTRSHVRIFVSLPLFIIADCILGVYAISALLIYLHRPGRFLPRLPTSIAAIIALFAGSCAVHDFRDMSWMTKKERRRWLKRLNTRYGYGTFVGGDGRLHVGIEKEPLVRVRPVPGIIEKVQTGLSKRSQRIP